MTLATLMDVFHYFRLGDIVAYKGWSYEIRPDLLHQLPGRVSYTEEVVLLRRPPTMPVFRLGESLLYDDAHPKGRTQREVHVDAVVEAARALVESRNEVPPYYERHTAREEKECWFCSANKSDGEPCADDCEWDVLVEALRALG